jgi:hypothetical protein
MSPQDRLPYDSYLDRRLLEAKQKIQGGQCGWVARHLHGLAKMVAKAGVPVSLGFATP